MAFPIGHEVPGEMEMISTTQCQECGGAIEFELDNWQEGNSADCPHCHQPTLIRRLETYAPAKSVPRNRSQIKPPKPVKKWRPVGASGEILVMLGGVGMLVIGLLFDLRLLFVGLIWLGLAVVLGHLRNLAEKP